MWDSTDLLVSLVQSDPSMTFLPVLFGQSDSSGILDMAIRCWHAHYQEPSTSLALLEIAETILLVAPKPREEFRYLVDKSTTIVSTLLQNDPSLVASRQYLRWMLIKIWYESYGKDERPSVIDSPVGNPGVFLVPYHALCLPIYVPCQSESPTLLDRKKRTDLVPFIRTTLDGARSFGDYDTEALCLQALVRESAEPEPIYDELAQLQRHTQEDIQGCLQTLLSKYIFCRDQQSRTALRDQIVSLQCGESFPNTLLWARAMILRALSVSTAEAFLHYERAKSLVYYRDISKEYRPFMRLVEQLQRVNLNAFSEDQRTRRALRYDMSNRYEVHQPSTHRQDSEGRAESTVRSGAVSSSHDRGWSDIPRAVDRAPADDEVTVKRSEHEEGTKHDIEKGPERSKRTADEA